MNKKIKLLIISTVIINSMFSYCCHAADNDNKMYSTKEIKPINLNLDNKTNTEKKVEQVEQKDNKQNTDKDISFIIDTSKIPKDKYIIQGITEIGSSNKITYKESINIKSDHFEITSNKLLGTEETEPNKIYNVDIQLLNKENKVILNKKLKCQRQNVKEDLDRNEFVDVLGGISITIIIVVIVFLFLLSLYLNFFF